MCQLEPNKKLASTFPGLVYTKEKHNYNTRSARKNLLDIPHCQTFTYGTQSCKYQCIKDWNRFKKENATENLLYQLFFSNTKATKASINAEKMKFSINDFFSKYDQICRKLQIWSHLLKKSLMENFIFCAVLIKTTISESIPGQTVVDKYLMCAWVLLLLINVLNLYFYHSVSNE